MNIFASYRSAVSSAEALDDSRRNKMLLESCQMLATAVQYHGKKDPNLYKPTHVNHPCNVWARQNAANWDWLYRHAEALLRLYEDHRQKTHGCAAMLALVGQYSGVLPEGPRTPFTNAARNTHLKLDFTHLPVQQAYRRYLTARWQRDKRKPTWGGNPTPPFWETA